MTLRYLPDHAQALLQSIELAHKEAQHLRYSQSTLFALAIDLRWVEDLGNQPELAEKVEAFVSRFGRLQDHLGEKLLPRYATLVGETVKTQIDTLAFAERAGVLASTDAFIAARRLRNALVHEYMQDAQLFLENLLAANPTCELFYNTLTSVETELKRLGVVA